MLSPCPEIQHQVKKFIRSDYKESCNNLLAKLFVPKKLRKEETNAFLAKVEDEFWTEWTDFNECSEQHFSHELQKWLSEDIPNNNSHLWHRKYSLDETRWLGRLACLSGDIKNYRNGKCRKKLGKG